MNSGERDARQHAVGLIGDGAAQRGFLCEGRRGGEQGDDESERLHGFSSGAPVLGEPRKKFLPLANVTVVPLAVGAPLRA